jgi:type IV pilus assembly protein PilV
MLKQGCHRDGGFTLIEVLVAMLILSIGLMGMAGLQAVSLKMNQSAHLSSQATFLAYDIMDRMRANRTAALNQDYDMSLGCTAPTATGVVKDDLENWLETLCGIDGAEQSASGVLPQDDDGNTGASIDVDDKGLLTVTLAWYDARWQEQGATGKQDANPIKTISVSAQL